MKTAEEILEKYYYGGELREVVTPDIIKAMEEYAEQKAIAFLESIRDYERENGERICFDERTSKELYTDFLTSY